MGGEQEGGRGQGQGGATLLGVCGLVITMAEREMRHMLWAKVDVGSGEGQAGHLEAKEDAGVL